MATHASPTATPRVGIWEDFIDIFYAPSAVFLRRENGNVFIPLMARNLFDSIELLAAASRLLSEKCVDGIEANRERNELYAESTLSAATALNPFIGYDKATEIVKEASASGRPLREVARDAGVDESILDEALDYHAMAKPHG